MIDPTPLGLFQRAASSNMPEEFFCEVLSHLPPEQPVGPRGGRPPKPHRVVMRVIWFVLVTGCRWEDVPKELGCSGRTAHRRLRQWQELGLWDRLRVHLLTLLRKAGRLDMDTTVIDSVMVRAFGGGERSGPSPVDRRKRGVKHTLLVDSQGAPLVVHSTPANESDQRQALPAILDFPLIGGKPGRPKTHPGAVYADRGYDDNALRAILRWLGIEPRIARRRTAHGSGLGRVRWVVERTIAWFKGLRRMRIRYDRSAVIQDAWNALAAAVICYRIIEHNNILKT
jgi:transposase